MFRKKASRFLSAVLVSALVASSLGGYTSKAEDSTETGEEILVQNEEWDLAEELFMVLKGIDPENTATILNTALFLDKRGSYYRNSGLIDDADAYDNDALNYYKIAMNAEPPVVEAFFNAGFLRFFKFV